jgi:tRNA uridine 5-carboxymethylaminomethyl modification enzyme
MDRVKEKIDGSAAIEKFVRNHSVEPEQVNAFLEGMDNTPVTQKGKLHGILLRPHISLSDLTSLIPELHTFLAAYDQEVQEYAEITMKYEGYIQREQDMVDKMNRLEDMALLESFDYHKLSGLSNEAREKLTRSRPRTIGQASRISGVSPADISVLLIHAGR